MAKTQEPVITVRAVFAGTRTDRQAFIDLILEKRKFTVDMNDNNPYNKVNPNRGVHGGTENYYD